MSELSAGGAFIEVGHYQACKAGQGAEGDSFLSQKGELDGRVITVLSDGLGSGIKAGVLSTLTATMAMKFVAADIPMKRAAGIIMNTLPVCKVRGISYATFTIVDIAGDSSVRIMEYDNPPFVLIRDNAVAEIEFQRIEIDRKEKKSAPAKEAVLRYTTYRALPGDRLVFFSDGVTQSGMGTRAWPLGWGIGNVRDFLLAKVAGDPGISARELARVLVSQAKQHDAFKAKDDITCGVIYFRAPRELLIMSGPPVNPERDAEMVRAFQSFPGKKIICGGTTANIVARELGLSVRLDLKHLDPVVPPTAMMDCADLVTEGIITLSKVSEILERGALIGSGDVLERRPDNGARKIVELMLDSDRITFMVGTKINEAHQDPNMPEELEMRRNIVKKIKVLLCEVYLKEASIKYL
jgi:hypothetical protein